jgi:Alginate lyase
MRRPSIVVLLAVVVCTVAGWTGASVLAQPAAHHRSSTGGAPSVEQNPFRSLARGGYLPGSATRAPSGPTQAPGKAEVTASGRPASGGADGGRDRPATRPSQVLDLRNWYLTLPSGSAGDPDTVRQPDLDGYSSRFFQVDPRGDGVVFTANAGGVTTKNSTYPRSELRETNGAEMASWSNRAGTHTLFVRQAVTELPTAKPELVSAQIHDEESDVMEVRLEDRRLVARYADGEKEFDLDPNYSLGTPYDLRIVATEGRIDVAYNGKQAGSIAQSGTGWYFKTGSYLQSNTEKGDAGDAVGKVVLYQVAVTHTG